MGSVTETYTSLSDVLLSDYAARRVPERDILTSRLLRPLLPGVFRCGMGQVVDVKDRQVGPFDIVACWEAYPPLGEGMAHLFFADGVAVCLQARNWKEEDLTQFAALAGDVKKLERRKKSPIFCGVVGFESLPAKQVSEFLRSPAGLALDGVLSLGQHVMVRNSQGWYGNPQSVPFVTEQGAGESLKAFAFWIVQIVQTFLGMPFSLTEYQHL